MTDLGAGIYLDSDFDLSPDSSGDVDGSDGIDELGKDLAVVVSEVLTTGSTRRLPSVYDALIVPDPLAETYDEEDEKVTDSGGLPGEPMYSGILRDVEVLVANLVGLDPRIDTVTRVSAEYDDATSDTVRINTRVQLADLNIEEFEFLIETS